MTKTPLNRVISLTKYKTEINDSEEFERAKTEGPRDRLPSGDDIVVPYDNFVYDDLDFIITYKLIGFKNLKRPEGAGDNKAGDWINKAIFAPPHPELEDFLKKKLGAGYEHSYGSRAAIRLGCIAYCNAAGFEKFKEDYDTLFFVEKGMGPVKVLFSLLLDGPAIGEVPPLTQTPREVLVSEAEARAFYESMEEEN